METERFYLIETARTPAPFCIGESIDEVYAREAAANGTVLAFSWAEVEIDPDLRPLVEAYPDHSAYAAHVAWREADVEATERRERDES